MGKLAMRLLYNKAGSENLLLIEYDGENPIQVWSETRRLIHKFWKIDIPHDADKQVLPSKKGGYLLIRF